MPLDDTNWSGVEIRDLTDGTRHSGNPIISGSRSRPGIRFEHVALAAMAVLFLGMLAFASEDIFPDAGLITRIKYGNAVADRNLVALTILAGSQRLTFSVAGIYYEVDTPSRPLTAGEQEALLGYAEFKGLPRYLTDGPLAIDP
jgi:hypothetical protein